MLNKNLSFINNKFENINLNKHFHEEYSFSLIYDGNHLYQNEKEKFSLGSGIIQIVNPYEIHSTKKSSWSYLNIMLNKDLINDININLKQNDNVKDILFNSLIEDKVAVRLFYKLFILLKNNSKNTLEIDISLIEFFEYIIKHHSSSKKESFVNITCSKKDINIALEYMNDYEKKDDITLDKISAQIGISKYHFIKEFKKHIGLTPNQYLQIKKTNWSKELIVKNMPLSHIAYECGFADQSYMIKVFKSFYGFTPSKLRKIII
ncbi:MAG: AraC family transcriptional regulator [Campylobacterales bacterium]|nr:AraC family transcriptional regulator [Campylobacterales bacterium]